MKKLNHIISLCFAASLFSCGDEPSKEIEGTYVRESTWQPKNINTEKILGIATIRDTIFVTKKKDGYQVDNAKWLKNDYDNKGWQEVSYSNGRLRPHQTKYDETDHSLIPLEPLMANVIYLDLDKGLLFFNKKREFVWKKAN